MELTVFIRHNWHRADKDQPELNETMVPLLYRNNQIGIHFQRHPIPEEEARNPSQYLGLGRGKESMELLLKMAENGALVYATYRVDGKNKIKLGRVKPQQVGLLPVEGRTGFFIKTLQMVGVTESSAPILLAIQPTQGTMVEWSGKPEKFRHKIEIINSLFQKKPLVRALDSLIPAQQEVLCYEYLKEKELIKHLLLPIGRTLEDLDIYGMDDKGKEVFAQVTFSNDEQIIKKKLSALDRYTPRGGKSYLFLQGMHNLPEEKNITLIDLETVFQHFNGQPVVDEMIHFARSDSP